MRRPGAVVGHHGPVVLERVVGLIAGHHHRLDGQRQPLHQARPATRAAVVRHVGRLVHRTSDAVSDVVLDDAQVTLTAHVALHRVRDVGDPSAQPGGTDAVPHRLLGDPHQLARLRGDRTHRHGQGGVAVPPVDDGAAVDGDDVPVGEGALPRDAVHDLVVDRGADRAGKAVVALERGRRAAGADVILRDRVELAGGDPGLDRVGQQLQRAPDHQAGGAHPLDLLGSLDLHPPVAEAHALYRPGSRSGASSCSKTRRVTSSTGPIPSIETSSPRSAYTCSRGAVCSL